MEQHKQYCKISKQDRRQIIHEVLVNKRLILEVAREFKVLPSTCKSIINTYIKEGRIGKKERRIRKLKKVTAIYTITLNPLNPLSSTISTECEIAEVEQPSLQSNALQQELPQKKPYDFLSQWTENYIQDYKKYKLGAKYH
ncbi:unnamed protein product [Paramecium sonneborni]|uniref:Uncharacterized protein n=1 Tax=Paramecium sonneborni TaxID=65129 RepID=A0A8S1QD78_9CILI|nr:unnamed protein product [Paramecium sonneborni]